MAFPLILINSATGSDTLASGAGPATAITGTKARTRNNANETRVGFFESSEPDLSGVATDGTHVVWFDGFGITISVFWTVTAKKDTQQSVTGNMASSSAVILVTDTTSWSVGDVIRIAGAGVSGADLYNTILTVDSSVQATCNTTASTTVVGAAIVNPKQVSIGPSGGLNTVSSDHNWAIGGKRASIGGTTESKKLFDINTAAGDARPGWVVEMESGHAETITATYTIRRTGDLVDGPILLRGTSGAATMPVLTFSNNGTALGVGTSANGVTFRDFEIRNSNATKTASVAFSPAASSYAIVIENIKCATSGSKFWKFLTNGGTNGGITVRDCEIGYTASNAITCSTAEYVIRNNYIHDITGIGITITAAARSSWLIQNNIIYNCTGDGINENAAATAGNYLLIDANTIDLCGGDGIEIASALASNSHGAWQVTNNSVSNSTGKNFNLSDAGSYQAALAATGFLFAGNNSYNGGSADVLTGASVPTTLNPQYTSPSTGDFTVGINMNAIAYSTNNIGRGSSTRSYGDVGAAQRLYRATPVANQTIVKNIATY